MVNNASSLQLSPGLVVTGDESCPRGCGCHLPDGHFFTLISCKNYIVCSEKTENNIKNKDGFGPLFTIEN